MLFEISLALCSLFWGENSLRSLEELKNLLSNGNFTIEQSSADRRKKTDVDNNVWNFYR